MTARPVTEASFVGLVMVVSMPFVGLVVVAVGSLVGQVVVAYTTRADLAFIAQDPASVKALACT